MNEDVLKYIRRAYTEAKHNIIYMATHILCNSPPTLEDFYKNWTINFSFIDSKPFTYKITNNKTIDSYDFYKLVLQDSNKGFFIKEARPHGARFRLTELGICYIKFKLEL